MRFVAVMTLLCIVAVPITAYLYGLEVVLGVFLGVAAYQGAHWLEHGTTFE